MATAPIFEQLFNAFMAPASKQVTSPGEPEEKRVPWLEKVNTNLDQIRSIVSDINGLADGVVENNAINVNVASIADDIKEAFGVQEGFLEKISQNIIEGGIQAGDTIEKAQTSAAQDLNREVSTLDNTIGALKTALATMKQNMGEDFQAKTHAQLDVTYGHGMENLRKELVNTGYTGENITRILTEAGQLVDNLRKKQRVSARDMESIFEVMGQGTKYSADLIQRLASKDLNVVKRSMSEIREEAEETNRSFEKMTDDMERAAWTLKSWLGVVASIAVVDVTFDRVLDSFKEMSNLSGSIFTQFQGGAPEISGAFSSSADAASRVGESLEVGVEAFNAIRQSGVRSLSEVNKTLDTASFSVLTIGGDIQSWGSLLGDVQYNLRLSSDQMDSMMKQVAFIQKQFSLTTEETQELLGTTKDVMDVMYRMGNASGTTAANITKALAAAKTFRAGETIENVTRALTSAQSYFEATGETQLLIMRMAQSGVASMEEILSGDIAGTKKQFELMAAGLQDVYDQASLIENSFERQQYLQMHGIRGMKELEQSLLAANQQAKSFEEKQAEIAGIMSSYQSGGTSESVARAQIELVTGKKLEGPLLSAADKMMEAAKLEEQVSQGTRITDSIDALVKEQAKAASGLKSDVPGLLAKIQADNKDILGGINLQAMGQEQAVEVLKDLKGPIQKQAEIASKQLEAERMKADPILAFRTAVLGPINDLLKTLAGYAAKIANVIGPTGIKTLGVIVLTLSAMAATLLTIAALLKAKEFVGGAVGGVPKFIRGLFSGGAGQTKDIVENVRVPGTKETGAGKSIGSWVTGLVEGLRTVKPADLVKVLQIAGVMTAVATSMALGIYLLNRATKGIDPVGFIVGITGYTAAMLAITKIAKLIPESELVGSLKSIAAMTLVAIAIVPMAYALSKAISMMSGVRPSDILNLGLSLTMAGGLAYTISKLPISPGQFAGFAKGLLGFTAALLGIAALAIPLYVVQMAYSGLDMSAMVGTLGNLAVALLAAAGATLMIVAGALAIADGGTLLLTGLAGTTAALAAIAALSLPLYLVQFAYSGLDVKGLSSTMMNLALVFTATALTAASIAATGAILVAAAPLVAAGVVGAGLVLVAIAGISGALQLVTAALSGFDGIAFAKGMLGLGIGMVGMAAAAYGLAMLAPFALLAPLFVAGIAGATVTLGALVTMAPILMLANAALSGIDGWGFGKTMAGLGIAFLGLAAAAIGLTILAPFAFMAPLFVSSIIATMAVLGALAWLAPSIEEANMALGQIDTIGFAKTMAGFALSLVALGVVAATLAAGSLLAIAGPLIEAGIYGSKLLLQGLLGLAEPMRALSNSFKGINTGLLEEQLDSMFNIMGALSDTPSISGFAIFTDPVGDLKEGLEKLAGANLGESVRKLQSSFKGIGAQSMEAIAAAVVAIGSVMTSIGGAADTVDVTLPGWFGGDSDLDSLKKGLIKVAAANLGGPIGLLADQFSGINKDAVENVTASVQAIGAIFKIISDSAEAAEGATETLLPWSDTDVDNVRLSLMKIAAADLAGPISDIAYGFAGISSDMIENASAAMGLIATVFKVISENADSAEGTTTDGWFSKSDTARLTGALQAVNDATLIDSLLDFSASFSSLNKEQIQKSVTGLTAIPDIFLALSTLTTAAESFAYSKFFDSKLEDLSDVLEVLKESKIGLKIGAFVDSFAGAAIKSVDPVLKGVQAVLTIFEALNSLSFIAPNLLEGEALTQIDQALKRVAETDISQNMGQVAMAFNGVEAQPIEAMESPGMTPRTPGVIAEINANGNADGLSILAQTSNAQLQELAAIREILSGISNNGIKLQVGGGGNSTSEKAPVKQPRSMRYENTGDSFRKMME